MTTVAESRVGPKQRLGQRLPKGPVRLLMVGWCMMVWWRPATAEQATSVPATSDPGDLQSPFFDSVANNLYFCDSKASTINRFNTDSNQLTSASIHDAVGLSFIIPIGQPTAENMFAVGMAGNVCIFLWDGESTANLTAQFTILVVREPNGIMFGRADPNGLLFVSTTSGEIYSIGPDREVTLQLSYICRPDGFTWGISDPYFYYVEHESSTLCVHEYNLDDGVIAPNSSMTYDFKANNISGVPRTVAFDADGNLWVSFSVSNQIVQLKVTENVGPEFTSSKQLQLANVGLAYFTFGGQGDAIDKIYATTSLGLQLGSGVLLRVDNAGAQGLGDRSADLQ